MKELKRYYLHGDVLEDGKRYYNARTDLFEPLPALEATPMDVERYRLMLKNFDPHRHSRPLDAGNIYADSPLLKLDPRHFAKLVRKARRSAL